jgi:tRNA pseudouridine38-40 synthase
MPKFKLTIAYEGTAWQGWQAQRSGLGVQNAVHRALAGLFPSHPEVTGSSRTDAGVHARGLVAHVEIPADEMRMPVRHLPLAINALLPPDIRVMAACRVPAAFHARFDAVSKEYHYEIWNHPVMDPLRRNQAWHVPQALDIAAMRQAAAAFEGRHDFRAFTANRGGELRDPVRTLHRCAIRRQGHQVTFILVGGGFLYKMCRGIVGTLVQIGQGRHPADSVPELLATGDRRRTGVNAPAYGLTLWRVRY